MSLRKIKGTQAAIDYIIKNNVAPQWGAYSHSRLSMCPEAFKKKYIEKAPEENATRFATSLGTHVHGVLEVETKLLANEVQRPPEEVVDHYILLDENAFEFQKELTDALVLFRENFPLSKETLIGSEDKLAANFSMEKSEFEDSNAWFRGIIDLFTVDANGVVEITDFKNFPHIHSPATLANINCGVGHQLMSYVALAFATYPSLSKAKGSIYYTRYGARRYISEKDEEGNWVPRVITRDDVSKWWRMLQRKMLSMERRVSFSPIPSEFNCQYCSFVSTCTIGDGENTPALTKENDAKGVLAQLIVLKEKTRRLQTALRGYVESNGNVSTPTTDYGPQVSMKTEYNLEKLSDAVGSENILKVVNVDKNKLKKLVSRNPELSDAVTKSEVYTTTTSVRMKKK